MRSQRAYLEHILECVRRLEEDSAGGKDAVFESHTLQDAVIRNLQVLCESAKRLEDSHKARHPEIPWKAIAGMRNVLVHDYFELDLEAIWEIVVRDLPALKVAAQAILTNITEPWQKASRPRTQG